jgi:hypothetical protein
MEWRQWAPGFRWLAPAAVLWGALLLAFLTRALARRRQLRPAAISPAMLAGPPMSFC